MKKTVLYVMLFLSPVLIAQSKRVIPISGLLNNCFFNALRHLGIEIDRERVVELITAHENDLVWRLAVTRLAIQEMVTL